MKSLLKTAACLTFSLMASASFADGGQDAGGALLGSMIPVSADYTNFKNLVEPAYIYAQAEKANINWMYIGFAPRMEEPRRVKVVMSKAGFTMRVSLFMTPEEVADYPSYLSRRYRTVKQIVIDENLTIPQQYRFDEYERTILAIENDLRVTPNDLQSRYAYGFRLLKQFFPQNTFEIVSNGSVARVEAHFVYPMTIHKSVTWPDPGVYRPYDMQERRSYYSKKEYSHIFGGFPAIWLDPRGKGTGVHGPIRYSKATDARKDRGEGKMRQFWNENNFLNEATSPVTDLNPSYRWDVVRRANSDGCFRAETLEPRHLLPSDSQRIKDDNKEFRNLGKGPGRNTQEVDYDSVEFELLAGYDYLTVEGHMTNMIVNVGYYVLDHYRKSDENAWLKEFMLTPKQRNAKDADIILQSKMATEIYTFPYLHPQALEYYIPSKGASSRTMTLLNSAH